MVEELAQSAFLWWNFTADVTFTMGGADFSECARSVCVLDFVLMLHAARTMLREDALAVLELSDRQDEWHFTRDNDSLGLRTRHATREGWRFHSAEGRCQATQFDDLVDQSLTDALGLIFSLQPSTKRNPYLQGLSRDDFSAA